MASIRKNHKTSYGVIAYAMTDSRESIRFLLVQQKYSHSYIAIIRGHYDTNKEGLAYLESLVGEITALERKKLLTYSHDLLWNKLWSFSSNNGLSVRERSAAKKKFDYLIERGILVSMFSQIPPTWLEPEWGFPKGKKYHNERDHEAAHRELLEETGIPEEMFTMHKEDEIEPVSENYIGDNGVHYQHIYYLARCEMSGVAFTNPWDLTQVGEIGKLGWFNYDEATKLLRPHHNARKNVMRLISQKLQLA